MNPPNCMNKLLRSAPIDVLRQCALRVIQVLPSKRQLLEGGDDASLVLQIGVRSGDQRMAGWDAAGSTSGFLRDPFLGQAAPAPLPLLAIIESLQQLTLKKASPTVPCPYPDEFSEVFDPHGRADFQKERASAVPPLAVHTLAKLIRGVLHGGRC